MHIFVPIIRIIIIIIILLNIFNYNSGEDEQKSTKLVSEECINVNNNDALIAKLIAKDERMSRQYYEKI